MPTYCVVDRAATPESGDRRHELTNGAGVFRTYVFRYQAPTDVDDTFVGCLEGNPDFLVLPRSAREQLPAAYDDPADDGPLIEAAPPTAATLPLSAKEEPKA